MIKNSKSLLIIIMITTIIIVPFGYSADLEEKFVVAPFDFTFKRP